MNELNELFSLLDTVRARAERLRDLQSPLYFESVEDHFYKAQKNLARLEKKLAEQLTDAEQRALAAL